MVWRQEGIPEFFVVPGDIVDRGGLENYKLAKNDLLAQLGNVPFYPGIGNHEYQPDIAEDDIHTAEEFSAFWGVPVRYSWSVGDVVCIMLNQPMSFLPGERREHPHVVFPDETLAFLEQELSGHADKLAIIFAHCPLKNTVLDRDPDLNLDDDSLDTFFFVENSQDVRDILARHRNAGLYISGHTHSGWGSPQLVFTERLGNHPVTHVNLMSPWYTGRHHGAYRRTAGSPLEYRVDVPDVLASFAFHIYRNRAIIRVRDHRSQVWLAEWVLPLI